MSYVLRAQQVVFEDALRQAFRRHRCVIGVAPTGFGKGHIAGDMVFKAVTEKGKRPALITHRRQVVLQLTEHCQKFGVPVGVVMGNTEADPEAPVQVASAQTLQRRGFSAIARQNFLIIDECHQFFRFYRKLIREAFPSIPILGFTATPVGPGGAKIDHFDVVVEPIKNSEVIAAGDLLPVYPYLAPSEPDLAGINLKTASQNEVGQRVEATTLYSDVFQVWQPYSHMQTLVLLPSRAVCHGFHQECLKRGITAKIVDGTTQQMERDETFSEFKQTDCQMILGVDVIAEGLDLPIARCLIDLHPTYQFRRFWQAVGRIKRPHNGQDSAVVIDMAGNLWRHMVHPDQDPPWKEVTVAGSIEEVIERKAGVRCPVCGATSVYSIKGHGYKCENCQHTWQTKKPFVCPECKQALAPHQKCVGGKCPNCGAKLGKKPFRRIRMADGTMRAVLVDEIKKRKKSKANKEQSVWDGCRYKAHYCKRTLDFARVLYKKEIGDWPDGTKLKNCPSTANSGDWKRAPSAVYPWMGMKRKATTN